MYHDIADIISVDSFTLDSNQILFKCLQYCVENEVTNFDVNTILSSAKSLDYYDFLIKRNETEHLRAILNTPVEEANVRKLAAKLKKLEITRGAIEVLNRTQNTLYNITGDETLDAILAEIENPVFDYVLEESGDAKEGAQKLGSTVKDYIDYVSNSPREFVGIPTGFKIFDYAIGGGLRPGVTVIGARPKVGKTTLNMGIGFHISRNLGIPVLIIDTEMRPYEYHGRALANISGLSIRDIETGSFAKQTDGIRRVKEAGTEYENAPLYHVSVLGKSFDETLSIIRRWLLKTVGVDENGKVKQCVVIYDFLRTTDRGDINSNVAEYQALGFQMMELATLVKRYDVPALAFVQLNRDGITKEHSGTASGSDRIVWFANVFAIFKKKSAEEIANDGISAGNRKLIPLDLRHGPGLNDGEYICLQMDGSRCKVTELKLGHIADSESDDEDFEDDTDDAF